MPTTASRRQFPTDFLFGAAASAYQIEGAAHEDGRTDSIWDAFSRVPGAVVGMENGDVACDHYHRYRDDVKLMADLGLDSYRFSTSWARVCPDGGPVNPAGIDFYSRLVDELLEHGILPWLTLYHWDLPQALEDQGGWPARDTAYRFVDYALAVHDALGDRVSNWTTLNEPWCASFLSYIGGEHAPGRQDPAAGLAAGHHLLLGHGLVIEELRRRDPELSLGITLNLTVADPVNPEDPADVDAARRIDGQFNRFFLDPIFRGSYPADLLADVAHLGFDEVVHPGDLATIAAPIDLLGVNYYHGELVGGHPPTGATMTTQAPSERPKRSPFPAAENVHWHLRDLPLTAMQWEVQPEGLTRLLRRVHDEYTGPAGTVLAVTENGAAYDDVVAEDGAIPDDDRVAFLEDHLEAILDAIDEGVPVRGYFYWSLMDNFEWAWGYDKRFGIVRVDYATQERTLKDSALAYRAIIADRAL
ncbi:beta-glucosidase [Microbacteriaceae bacterium SG_E_30_P1]|uniref:Beta-glucosidase n=1 Tax=Antiquaquibacter oligotrophicus TaxID=2880260 RepID=A0ABT6KQD5_9MICO|nr:GH1 family beta-glucosidase [Antiquaquibacter oligotrophicus]MDH6182193.1 beta-glucosidase [Antiquaquibacter oligotrophicus]UDF12147.1 beta-glucosidase [Antiquaquibacter oligotrophicus]